MFTGFTMAGAGMAKYHLTHREDHWRRRLVINGTAAALSFVVLVIIAVAKFTEGAWVILVILPVGVFVLLRLHRQYVDEEQQLEEGASEAAEAPVLRRHVVIVFVDRLDLAAGPRPPVRPDAPPRRPPGRPLRHSTTVSRRRSRRSGAGSG